MFRRYIFLLLVFGAPKALEAINICAPSELQAETECDQECPNGKDTECDNGYDCWVDVVCVTDAPTPVPTPPPPPDTPPYGSLSYFRRCGESWTDADQTCGYFCPSGWDSECPDGLSCFTNISCNKYIPVLEKRCGTDFDTASQTCGTPCPEGLDNECPTGESCFEDVICILQLFGAPPSSLDLGETQLRCGTSTTDSCGTECPGGSNDECVNSWEYCFETTLCESGAFNLFQRSTVAAMAAIIGTIFFWNI